jgi:DNA-binding GntR family transcriptional regulator
MPASLAAGTPLAGPAAIPEDWTTALARYTGQPITHVTGHITARHPNATEAAALGLPPHGVVLLRTETHHTATGPADYTLTVWPGESTHLTTERTPTQTRHP